MAYPGPSVGAMRGEVGVLHRIGKSECGIGLDTLPLAEAWHIDFILKEGRYKPKGN